MKETRSLSEFRWLSKFTRLYPIISLDSLYWDKYKLFQKASTHAQLKSLALSDFNILSQKIEW